jgi:hypothetical protein
MARARLRPHATICDAVDVIANQAPTLRKIYATNFDPDNVSTSESTAFRVVQEIPAYRHSHASIRPDLCVVDAEETGGQDAHIVSPPRRLLRTRVNP